MAIGSMFSLLLTSLLLAPGAFASILEYGLPPLPRNVEVLQYDLRVQPYFPEEVAEWDNNRTLTFDGFVRISFRSIAFADHLSLDSKNLTILSVRLYQDERIVEANHSMDSGTGRLRVVPEGRFIPPLNYTIEVAYAGDIVFGGRENGVIYGTYKNRRGNQSFMVYTQFEPQDARRMMPCWDDPHFKAVVQLSVTYPDGYTALSNTIPQTNYTSGGGYVTTTFFPTPRMSTYLIAFAVGKLVSKLDISSRTLVRVWGWEGMEDYLDYALRSTVGCIIAMKEYTQMGFGQPKLDLLAVPALTGGAMENWGLIISSSSAVYADPQVSSPNRLWGIALTQCHETVHQWFGDLVTADRWGDLFLHESFATYFSTTITKRFIPAEHHRFIDSERVVQVGTGLNAAEHIYHPLVYNQSDFYYVYEPGAAILNTVEWTIGEDAFQRALRSYLQQHRLGNAVYRDLADAFLEESRQANFGACSNSLNLSHFLDAFFLQPSFPMITVELSNSGYVVSQAPYNRSSAEENHESLSWDVPLLSVHADGSYSRYWMLGNHTCEEQPRSSELDLVLGRAYSPFARIRYDNRTFETLMKAITGRPDLFDDDHLMRLVFDEFSYLAHNTSVDPFRVPRIMFDRLSRAGVDGKISASLFALMMEFAHAVERYLPPAVQKSFMNATRDALEPLYQKIGWNASSERSWDERALQSAVLFHAVYFDMKEALDDAQRYVQRFLSECFTSGTHHNVSTCNSLHVDVRQAVYCAAFKSGDNDTTSLVMQYLKHFEQDAILGYLEPQIDQFGAAKCLAESPPTVLERADITPSKRGHGHRANDVLQFPAGVRFGHGSDKRI